MTGPMLADRVRKARRQSRCPMCRRTILIGDHIGRTPDGWTHIECILAQIGRLMRQPPQPSAKE